MLDRAVDNPSYLLRCLWWLVAEPPLYKTPYENFCGQLQNEHDLSIPMSLVLCGPLGRIKYMALDPEELIQWFLDNKLVTHAEVDGLKAKWTMMLMAE